MIPNSLAIPIASRQTLAAPSEIAGVIPSCIVRFAAVYSDWCEYPPLYMFLSTWLSRSLRRNFLAGKGHSAVPYIHIRDIITFFRQLITNYNKLKPAQVIIASPGGSTPIARIAKSTSISINLFNRVSSERIITSLVSGFSFIYS